jgi:hypothetical protein
MTGVLGEPICSKSTLMDEVAAHTAFVIDPKQAALPAGS